MKSTKILFFLAIILFAQISYVQAQKGGVIFDIPKDVFPIDWKKNGFKGILMLRKASSSGIFIAYPDDGEKMEDFKQRAAKSIAPMVIQDDNGGKNFKLEKTSFTKRENDSADAVYYSYANQKSMAQVIVYERIVGGKSFIYGYFASRGKDENAKENIWADEKGLGVKFFEKFWKSIKE